MIGCLSEIQWLSFGAGARKSPSHVGLSSSLEGVTAQGEADLQQIASYHYGLPSHNFCRLAEEEEGMMGLLQRGQRSA